MTRRRYVAPRLYMVTPAATRRPTTPTTLSSTTAAMTSRRCTTAGRPSTCPAAKAGATTSSVTQPIAQAVPTVMTP